MHNEVDVSPWAHLAGTNINVYNDLDEICPFGDDNWCSPPNGIVISLEHDFNDELSSAAVFIYGYEALVENSVADVLLPDPVHDKYLKYSMRALTYTYIYHPYTSGEEYGTVTVPAFMCHIPLAEYQDRALRERNCQVFKSNCLAIRDYLTGTRPLAVSPRVKQAFTSAIGAGLSTVTLWFVGCQYTEDTYVIRDVFGDWPGRVNIFMGEL